MFESYIVNWNVPLKKTMAINILGFGNYFEILKRQLAWALKSYQFQYLTAKVRYVQALWDSLH